MCKVLILTNMSKVKKLPEVVNTICEHITESERHGFGYSIQGAAGVYGERSNNPDTFQSSWAGPDVTYPFATKSYNRFGEKSKAIGAGLFHGRTSTNSKELRNVHPINKHGWSLIHNGVVSYHGNSYEMNTSNDTEHLVELMGTRGITAIEQEITGYYALGAISPDSKLHVVRDSIAPLHVCYIESIDSHVFGTTASLISEVCQSLNWKHSIIETVQDNQYLVFEGNKLVSQSTIAPKGRSVYADSLASLSLGHSLVDDPAWDTPSAYMHPIIDNGYTDSELAFLDEVRNFSDSSYRFFDYKNEEIDHQEVMGLSDDTLLSCTVVRSDGTIVDQVNYDSEKLFEGKVG